ncbi:hypothetical protein BH23ACT12_BH23ACT12_00150 [soil metagenome]
MRTTTGPEEATAGGRLRRTWPHIAFMAVTTVAIFWRHLFSGWAFPHDYLAFSRWGVFHTNTLGAGHFTEWIPFIGGGMALPNIAASGAYFPLWWVMGVLHIPATVTVLSFVHAGHILLGGTGVFVLAISLGVDRRWALVAGTAFLFFGGLYSNGFHDLVVRGQTYAPWLLWTLTPPKEQSRGWLKVLFLPLWAWVFATGGYPGQVMAFLQVGGVYLAAHLWLSRTRLKEFLPYLAAAVVASIAVITAVYLPGLVSDRAGELYRPFPPTVYWRGIFALHPIDFLGLYLNPFAWDTPVALITGWAVGAVVLIGLTAVGRQELRRKLPLVLAGITAFLLAFLPSWTPAGRIMASIPLLYPSRLPASDSKALAGVALVILGAIGWSRIAAGAAERPLPLAAGLGLLLIAGALLAPQYTAVPPARYPLLVAAPVAAAALVILLRTRLNPKILVALVLLLTVAEGARVVIDMQIFPGRAPWAIPAEEFPERALHNRQARQLRNQLDDPPATRPGRIPEKSADLALLGGDPNDALGYLGNSYNLGDFGSFLTTARRRVTLDPELRALMYRPWTAWVWSCEEIDCSGRVIKVPEFNGKESDRVRTLSYGLDTIRYRVDLPEDSLMIENETWARGWSADRAGIEPVSVDGTLRGWVLPAGEYGFTASYALPERGIQLGLAAIALTAMAVSGLLYRRSRKPA